MIQNQDSLNRTCRSEINSFAANSQSVNAKNSQRLPSLANALIIPQCLRSHHTKIVAAADMLPNNFSSHDTFSQIPLIGFPCFLGSIVECGFNALTQSFRSDRDRNRSYATHLNPNSTVKLLPINAQNLRIPANSRRMPRDAVAGRGPLGNSSRVGDTGHVE